MSLSVVHRIRVRKISFRIDHVSVVSALEPFFCPLNTITYAILDTKPGLHSVYLVDILLFYFTFYILPTIYYLRIIYLRNTNVLTYKLEVPKTAGIPIK